MVKPFLVSQKASISFLMFYLVDHASCWTLKPWTVLHLCGHLNCLHVACGCFLRVPSGIYDSLSYTRVPILIFSVVNHYFFPQVVGIEMNASAVSDAQRNAEINGIANCKFICAKVWSFLPCFIYCSHDLVM